jgi:hypothetical protein
MNKLSKYIKTSNMSKTTRGFVAPYIDAQYTYINMSNKSKIICGLVAYGSIAFGNYVYLSNRDGRRAVERYRNGYRTAYYETSQPIEDIEDYTLDSEDSAFRYGKREHSFCNFVNSVLFPLS